MFIALALCAGLVSCSDDDDKKTLTFKNLTLKAGETATIENGKNISWVSDNELIASVSNDVVTAERVGSTTILDSEYEFSVTVQPTITLYKDPCFKWGASMSTVKSTMSGYSLMNSNEEGLLYEGKQAEDFIMYMFENNSLKYSVVYVPVSYSDEVADFLLERYVPITVDEEEGYIGMISIDEEMAIIATIATLSNTYYWQIIYGKLDADENSRSNTSLSQSFGEMFNTISSYPSNDSTTKEYIREMNRLMKKQ